MIQVTSLVPRPLLGFEVIYKQVTHGKTAVDLRIRQDSNKHPSAAAVGLGTRHLTPSSTNKQFGVHRTPTCSVLMDGIKHTHAQTRLRVQN